MPWAITKSQSEDEWFEDYVKLALSESPPSLPPEYQVVGNSRVAWRLCEPGLAFIEAKGGSPDDRILARFVVKAQLRNHGIYPAQFTFDWHKHDEFRRIATWDDIEAKAKRLIQSGNVQLLRNGYNNIVAQVQGDHGSYQVEIGRDDPNSRAITTWQCECPWDQYAWQRTRQWKKYEGRPCAHVLAAYWLAQTAPLDEDAHPATQQGEQMSLFNQPVTMPPSGRVPRGPAPPPQGIQMPIPGTAPGQAIGTPPMAPGTPEGMPPGPAGPDILPQFQDPAQMPNPVSIPGGKPPSPLNPIQYPGGTFSSIRTSDGWDFRREPYENGEFQGWKYVYDTAGYRIGGYAKISHVAAPQSQGFQNGNIVSTKADDDGVWVGKSEEHGAGSPAHIPKGSPGEVLGQDPATGMVNVLFMNEALGVQEHGPLMPYGATAWFFPSQLAERPDIRRPGPAIKRR